MNSKKYFLGACILAAGLLFKVGAPLLPVGLGIGLVAFVNWKRTRQPLPRPRV
jgi:hypothetical protein